MRDIETIDTELRLVKRAWRVAQVLTGRIPSTELLNKLLEADQQVARPGVDQLHTGPQPRNGNYRAAAGPRLTCRAGKVLLIALAKPPMQVSCSSPISSTGQDTPAKTMSFVRVVDGTSRSENRSAATEAPAAAGC
ncbi:MAG TPA: hypothetical protein VGI68_23430 [Mycobacterium sp.]|jgi:hypothetical protein